jgi:hypothetical protein
MSDVYNAMKAQCSRGKSKAMRRFAEGGAVMDDMDGDESKRSKKGKGGTTVNIVIAPQQPGGMMPPAAPPMPMPPPEMGPPLGGMPPAGLGAGAPMPPMRKRGGRV